MRIGDVMLCHWTEVTQDRQTKNFKVKRHHYTERDCENCPFSWESRGYEGECYDDGCRMAKPRLDIPYVCVAKTWVCLLPRWVKRLIKRMRGWEA